MEQGWLTVNYSALGRRGLEIDESKNKLAMDLAMSRDDRTAVQYNRFGDHVSKKYYE